MNADRFLSNVNVVPKVITPGCTSREGEAKMNNLRKKMENWNRERRVQRCGCETDTCVFAYVGAYMYVYI